MNPAHTRRVLDLYKLARTLGDDRRSHLLQEQRDAEPRLVQEVEAMLREDDEDDEVLGESVIQARRASLEDLLEQSRQERGPLRPRADRFLSGDPPAR